MGACSSVVGARSSQVSDICQETLILQHCVGLGPTDTLEAFSLCPLPSLRWSQVFDYKTICSIRMQIRRGRLGKMWVCLCPEHHSQTQSLTEVLTAQPFTLAWKWKTLILVAVARVKEPLSSWVEEGIRDRERRFPATPERSPQVCTLRWSRFRCC